MKILYFITRSDTLGGAHIHVADMAQWMRMHGHEAIVAVGGEGPYCDHLTKKNVPYINCRFLVRPINPAKDIIACYEMRRIIRQQRPDLVSLHSAKAGLVGRLAKVGIGVPTIFTAHGWSFIEGVSARRAALYKALEKLAAPFANRIITVSEHDREWAIKANLSSEQKVITIHNGMPDISHSSRPGLTDGYVRIIMVARLDEPKDHSTLFAALSKLKEYNWILDLVGDGPKEHLLGEQADKLGLSRRVNFLGLRNDVEKLLTHANFFVLSTKSEGFPRSILEAMRAGLPVIASDVGGVSEAVIDGETGYLVPRENTAVITNRLIRLLEDSEERIRMGNAGRSRFEERFLFERMAEQTFNVYKELIGST